MTNSPADVTLGTIIAYIESSDNQQALRFEPRIHERIHDTLFSDKIVANIRKIHNCTFETACVIYSTSFGKYQIMGNVLYDETFINQKATIFSYCTISSIGALAQDADFYAFCKHRSISFSVRELLELNNRQKFAIRYNGGLSYATSIAGTLTHFGIT